METKIFLAGFSYFSCFLTLIAQLPFEQHNINFSLSDKKYPGWSTSIKEVESDHVKTEWKRTLEKGTKSKVVNMHALIKSPEYTIFILKYSARRLFF